MGKKIMLDVLKHFRRGLNSDRPLELKKLLVYFFCWGVYSVVIISIDEITENSFGSVWTLDFPVELVIFGTLEPGTQHVKNTELRNEHSFSF